ncbi:20S proteasome subunit alpha 1 [Strigomonas culicis]|uniref:20S proteasome subunit alpha 1 n=1 Tax=Strigomonas culicis TaxID=28005 RepID=S9UPM7_9TRYP|nr:20S proteasome subunit alpha 1 [Strigomonas culicis]|eukprot:EPY30848.1 20S proteasome subunit alpha 1 [Strigomonas culicis]
MGDKAQVRTQHAGIRPMGVVSVYIGFDESDETGEWVPQIWTVDPAGFVCGHFATAVGKKYVEASAYLEKRQKATPFDGLSEKDIAMIALSALQNAMGTSVKASDVEMGRCRAASRAFERIPNSEVEEWLTAVAEAD